MIFFYNSECGNQSWKPFLSKEDVDIDEFLEKEVVSCTIPGTGIEISESIVKKEMSFK
jgi:hypothetical protein